MPPSDGDYDLILVGGGLAAGLIAWRLAIDRQELRVAVVEREGRIGGRHTWSFFDSDLDQADREWLAPATAHRWPAGHEVYFPARARTLRTAYNSITSETLHSAVAPLLGDDLIAGDVVTLDPAGVELADGRRLTGRAVVDARGPSTTPHLVLGWQVFLGQTLQLAQPHGLTRPTIMDATVPQSNGYRFVYLLPVDPVTVLVEDTYYSDSPLLDPAALSGRIDAYARSRGWTVDAVTGEERGVLPIALDGDIDAFWAEEPSIARAGLAAALFHPVTGYSLPDVVGLAREIAREPALSSPGLRILTENRSKRLWRERGFYRLLNRMLFRA
ncbi:MAG TPA: lycopene beta-cyclase CrtY, partial [Brevundimonas sp.]|nr:lycopene beta-cyclase CrtY [Brevundimonas sp.]